MADPTRPTDAAMREALNAWGRARRIMRDAEAAYWKAPGTADRQAHAWDVAKANAENAEAGVMLIADRIYSDSLASSLAAGQGVGGGERPPESTIKALAAVPPMTPEIASELASQGKAAAAEVHARYAEMKRAAWNNHPVNSIGTCGLCGYHGPGPGHHCAGRAPSGAEGG